MRTLLTMLGIVIGVGAVIVMVAVGNGAQSQIEAQINNLGTNLIVVTPGCTAAGRREPGRADVQPPDGRGRGEAEARRRRCFRAVSPVIVTRTQIISRQGELAHGDQRRVDGLSDHPRLGRHERRSLHRRRRARQAQSGGARRDRGEEPLPRRRSRGRARCSSGTCRSPWSACSRRRGRRPAASIRTTWCSCRTPPRRTG